MHRGYIKIWRKTEDSGLLQMPNTLALFMVMLFKAAYKPCRVGLIELERGQLSAGRFQLCEWSGLSEQNVRTCLKHLHDMKIITSKPTNKFTVYTFVNYGQYQDSDDTTNQQANQQSTNNQPATNQQSTTIKELKHLSIKENNINTMSPPASPKADPVQYEEIVKLYHQTLPMCPKVVMLTTKRKGQIAARWKSGNLPDLETWETYFKFISESPFLTGKTDPINGHKRFVADLEWITTESNFTKIAEKKYHGKV
jgi:hypothetical protein